MGQSEKLMPIGKLNDQLAVGQQVQHSIHELEPMTRYSMRVLAINALGRGRPSVALSLRTDEEGEFTSHSVSIGGYLPLANKPPLSASLAQKQLAAL